tara:strand:+ start:789 stop:1484 length:696 start_codon:yes stop_codon:yes gene_type:complete
MNSENKRILVVAAHPDDEVLGCGGTISKLSKSGSDVYIAILGEGITSRYDKRKDADLKLIEDLHEKSRRASKILGAKDLFMFSLPDNRFDTVPFLDIVKIIEKLIEELKPSVIYTHYGGDLNIDHKITSRAVITSTRPIKDRPVKDIYAFEVPSSTEWAFGQYQGGFNPTAFMDVSKTLNMKLKAMQVYDSEMDSFPHPRSSKGLNALAQYRGSSVGLEAAEGFEVVRKIN